MEIINFFSAETPWKKLWEKIPPKGGVFISSIIFIHSVDFFSHGIYSTDYFFP
jgi:hypothetical protein